mmetsp:Transcript_14203/g.20993  ORF Transcript_14203/g.20993 Transcript_14203/m.20993 type:complete len:523 (-) Transcript_14203:27-1595(-)
MPKANKSYKRTTSEDPNDIKERKMRKMSRALGVDLHQVEKLMKANENDEETSSNNNCSKSDPETVKSLLSMNLEKSEDASEVSISKTEETEILNEKEFSPKGKSGTVLFCGGSDWEKLGTSKSTENGNLFQFHKMSFKTRIVSVHCGPLACHCVVIDDCGDAYSWGKNNMGQCGVGSKSAVIAKPTKISPKKKSSFISASCGKFHTLLLAKGGNVYSFGCGSSGQLGIGKVLSEKNPALSPNLVNLPKNEKGKVVCCGALFSVILSERGKIYSFGHPEYGQLGNGTNGQYIQSSKKIGYNFVDAPTEIKQFATKDSHRKIMDTFSNVKLSKIACGKNHTLALEAPPGKRVFSWGFGGYGRLGHSISEDEYVPCVIDVLERLKHVTIKELIAGANCSLSLTQNGFVYFWGKLPNSTGGEATMYPKIVDDLGTWTVSSVAASGQCVMVGSECGVASWGQSIAGELGYGSIKPLVKSSRFPKIVDDLVDVPVLGISMGYAHSLVLVRDTESNDSEAIDKLPKYVS